MGDGDDFGGDISLLAIAPAEVPEDVFAQALSVAVDPSTPPLDEDLVGELLPDEPALAGTGDDIDLSDFDDSTIGDPDLDDPGADDVLQDLHGDPGFEPNGDDVLGSDPAIDHNQSDGSDDVAYTEHGQTGILDSDTGGTFDDIPSVDDA